MAGWSSLSNSSFIDVEVGVFDECEDRIKILFNKALVYFLKEEGNNNNSTSRPLPVVLGDGETVDLFKLFVLVRERGGFDSVSRGGLWDIVAEKLGLDCSVCPCLRLVYSKYLDRMEKWAVEVSKTVDWNNKGYVKKGCHVGLLHELGDGFRGLLSCEHMEESVLELDRPKKRFRGNGYINDDDEILEGSCVVISYGSECGEEDLSSEKKGSIRDSLKWLHSVATCPQDSSIGVIPHWSQWKENTGNECWIQVTRAQKALLVKREDFESRYENELIMNCQPMHPSLYEEDRKLKYNIRRPKISKASVRACSNGSLVTWGATGVKVSKAVKKRKKRKQPKKPKIPRRHVPIGPDYQIEVDEWTESSLESDTKWLGTRIWPLENKEDTLGNELVGKGRLDGCSCDHPGFVGCLRFHTAEKRMELKLELGDVFFRWRFNHMGEEVALRWTEREEERFKKWMVEDPKKFWKKPAEVFPRKKREQLVSYFFNVFLIKRRRYQNRVTPSQVNSDDEGSFGAIGNGYGRDAVSQVDSDTMTCIQNNQSFDLE